MGDPGGAAVLLRFLRIQGFLCLFLLPQTGSVLEVTAPSPHVAQKGSDTLIPCTFRVNKFPADPKFLAIYWDFNGRRILTYDNVVSTTDPRFSLDPNSAPRGEASLSVSNAQISDGGTYSCSVTYSPEQQQKEIIVEIQAPPQITITNRVVTENKESALRASIIGFYPQDLDVTWLRDGAILRGVTVNKPQRDPDGTYSTTSAVTIVPTEGNRNQNFSIRVQHESLTAPLQKNFQLLYAAAPSIHISHGPFYVNEEQTLMCRVWGYYPEDIAVSWFLDGSWVEPSEIKRINSSALELPYRFLPTAESQGMEISCVVEHWALTEPLVQSLKVELTDAQWSNTLIIIIIIIIIITIFAVALVAAVLFLKKKKRCCIRTGNREGTDKSKLPTEASKSGAPDTEEGGEDSEQTGLVGSQTDKETQQCPPIEENMADNGEQEPESSQDPSGEQDGDLNPDTVTERNEPRCPIFGKIHSSQKGNFFLEIKDFYPREMKVEWTGSPGSAGEERVTLRSDLLYTGENDNRTYNVISTCVGAGEKVNMNDMYTLWAQVQHQSLQLPHEVTLQQAKPKVKIEQSPAESGIRMICTLERFYPGFVEIRWLSAGKNVKSPNKEMNKKITRNNDGTFSARSEKVFSERELELGVRVIWEHESLAMPECRDLPLAGTDKSKLPTEASKSGAPETEEGGEDSEQTGLVGSQTDKETQQCPPIEENMADNGEQEPGTDKSKLPTEASKSGAPETEEGGEDSEQTGLVGSQTDKETQQCPPIEENMADNGEQEPGTDKSKLPTEASKSGAPETEEGGEDSEQTGLVGSQTDRETQQCPPIEENMADNGEQEPEEQSSEVLQDQEESETGPREKRIPNSPVMEEQE
uniref:Ig-like domain-containing protein n=1 Tax=Xenopus tropicalis TaxID=8364 RepID=A0A803K623_XENTR